MGAGLVQGVVKVVPGSRIYAWIGAGTGSGAGCRG